MTFQTVNLNAIYETYRAHVKFIIRRYGIPVKDENWLSLHGSYVSSILQRKALQSENEAVVMFLFLVHNVYVLGPKIVRTFFTHVHDETPRYSETGFQKWRALLEQCRAVILDGVTYHDIIGNKPLICRMEVFNNNTNRVLKS